MHGWLVPTQILTQNRRKGPCCTPRTPRTRVFRFYESRRDRGDMDSPRADHTKGHDQPGIVAIAIRVAVGGAESWADKGGAGVSNAAALYTSTTVPGWTSRAKGLSRDADRIGWHHRSGSGEGTVGTITLGWGLPPDTQ